MKRLICLLIALFTFIPLNGIYAQIKIGELKNGSAVITHDLQDLLQAIEKEYNQDNKENIKFLYAKIFVSKDNKYWLNAGNENPDSMFKFTILLEKSTDNNDLFISPYKIESPKRCKYCYNPDCGKTKDENGNIFYCSAAKPKPIDDNNKTQAETQDKRRLGVAVERYLLNQ